MKKDLKRYQNRGERKREARTKKHNLRAEMENEKMQNGNQLRFNYEFWGWTIGDPSPFLNIRVFFGESIIPVNFIKSIEKAITEKYNEYLQESETSKGKEFKENESDSPDLLLDQQRASLD